MEALVGEWHHDHVDSSVDPCEYGVGIVGAHGVSELVEPLPVWDDEALETKLPLEHVGEEEPIRMHFHTIPTRIWDHDSRHPTSDGFYVCPHVDVHKTFVAYHSVVLVNALCGSPIAHKVLRASN